MANSERPAFRVFLASSSELREERSRFSALVRDIGTLAGLARRVELRPVVWEHDAFGVGETIHESIKNSTEFQTLDVVVIVVWNRLGDGTLREYSDARSLWNVHKRPLLLAFFRTPSQGADPSGFNDVLRFKERLLQEGVATNEYSTPDEFQQRLREQLPKCVPMGSSGEPSAFPALRRRFVGTALAGVGLGSASIFLCRTVSFPVIDETFVYLVLALPVALALVSAMETWYYHRVLDSLISIWHSPKYVDQEAYEMFRSLVPRFAIPLQLRKQFPAGSSSLWLVCSILMVIFLVPLVGQYQCLFEEVLLWEYTVSHEHTTDSSGRILSRYVDRRRTRWPFGLQDEAVRAKQREGRARTIYVHAQGAFKKSQPLSSSEEFRRNLGPEVFLPGQAWLYVILMLLTSAEGGWVFWRLARFPREFALSMFDT
jgi:hypothetical protein